MDRPAAPFPRTSGSACQFPSAWTAGASEWCRHSRPSTGALPHRDGSGSGPVCPCFCCLGTRVSCESWKVPFQGCQPPAILTGQGDPRHPHPQLCDGPSTGRRLAQTLIPALSCVRSVCGSAPPAACPPASTGSRGSRRCSSRGAGVGGCEPPPRAEVRILPGVPPSLPSLGCPGGECDVLWAGPPSCVIFGTGSGHLGKLRVTTVNTCISHLRPLASG